MSAPGAAGGGRVALPVIEAVSERPVNCRRVTLIAASDSEPDNCSATRFPKTPIQGAVPPEKPALASIVTPTSALRRASFAVIVASPCTSCPASAANGATSGRCKSSVADCCPAVTACARSENSRCVAVSSSGLVGSSRRREALIANGSLANILG